VQGVGAAQQIANAIDALNAQGEAEVILVARGGGSLEELWAFNEETVARAIARSALPIVAGVGHESDFTIADFVADVRASTPTAAATIAAPDMTPWRDAIAGQRARLDEQIAWLIEQRESSLSWTGDRLARLHPASQIATGRRQVEDAERALRRAVAQLLLLRRERARATALRLDTLSPLKTLGRGYAIVRQAETSKIISSVRQAEQARRLRIQFADGSLYAVAANTAGPQREARRARLVADVALNQLSLLDVDEAPAETPPTGRDSCADLPSGRGKAPPHG
jgi:exodeoxyribonuclease VII large subunit